MTQQASLITEEMRKAIGVESEPVANRVEEGAIRRFAEAVEDPNPLWNDPVRARKSRYGSIIAPPTFFRSLNVADPPVPVAHGLSRLLDGGSEWEYFEPVRSGDTIYATQKVASLTERPGKTGKMLFLVYEFAYRNQFGELVATQKSTHICY